MYRCRACPNTAQSIFGISRYFLTFSTSTEYVDVKNVLKQSIRPKTHGDMAVQPLGVAAVYAMEVADHT